MNKRFWIAGLVLSGIGACNYTDGACWLRGQGSGQGGSGGGVLVPEGGGFGDSPGDAQGATITDCNFPDDSPTASTTGDGSQEEGLKVFCTKAFFGLPCSERCMDKGIPCVPMALHPFKTNAGIGKLFSCNDLPVGFMCGYHYDNGDDCYYPFGLPFPKTCAYSGND